tara:strand:+ start:1088 stop:2296 length:1209 start_codon:yes stop_codon:yes gene_type:complete
MRILFLTDNFPPEMNAPATRTWEHCKEWVNLGVDVTVITCAPNFPEGKVFKGYKNKFIQTEMVDGIKVVRVWSYISANSGFLKRIIDYTSYAIMAFIVGLWYKCDVIIATSPQFFTTISGYALSVFKRKPWVFELRDLWPESIRAVGAMENKKILDFFEKLELFLYKKANLIVPVTDSFKQNLIDRGISESKIDVIKNGVDLTAYKPIEKDYQLLDKLNLKDKFIISYIGTHGMAHGLSFILDSIKNLNKNIHFLFIGGGAEKENLIYQAKSLRLTNCTFLDFVPKSEISKYISITDVALVNLKKSETFKSVIPSKIFENAAMRKPILLGVEGESALIINSYEAGECFKPEDKNDFLTKLNKIYRKKVSGSNSYYEGLTRLANDFNRQVLAKRMLDLIKSFL